MKQAAQELVRALRGKRSQLALSRRLGYRGNPVANWETGRRFPTALEFLGMCSRLGVDVQAGFERFLPAAAASGRVLDDLPGWLTNVRGSTPLSVIAERAQCSRFAVSRFIHGKAEPRLPVFLTLVEAMTGRVSDLCAELVPIEQVPALEASYRRRQAARVLAFREPWTEAIVRVLETPRYRQSTGDSVAFIAHELALDEEVVQHCVDQLLAAGLVEADGPRHRSVGAPIVDTQASPELLQHVRAHWTAVALERVHAAQQGDQFGYNVFSIAERDLERVRGVLRASFREIRTIIANSEPSERVALVNLQLVQLTHAAKAERSSQGADHLSGGR